jgi:hypothetical protein
VKRESVSTLLIESKDDVLAGNLLGLVSNSIKNGLALAKVDFAIDHVVEVRA